MRDRVAPGFVMASRFLATSKSLGPLGLFLALGILIFPGAGRDDLHITLWPAFTLSEFGELTNYNGDRVEQSSSLLWTIVLAAARYLTSGDLTVLSRVLSLGAGGLCVLVLLRGRSGVPGYAAAWLLAANGYFAYWSASGMEQSCMALELLGLVLLCGERAPTWKWYLSTAALVVAAICTRPEAPFVLLMLFGALAAADRGGSGKSVSSSLLVILWTAAAVAVLTVFRLQYFGTSLPQPVLRKLLVSVGGRSVFENILRGVGYLLLGGARGVNFLLRFKYRGGGLFPFLVPVVLMAGAESVLQVRSVWRRRTNEVSHVALGAGVATLSYFLFALLVGGDWMEGLRLLVPTFPLIAMSAASFAARATVRARAVALGVIAGVSLLGAAWFQATSSMSLKLWESGLSFAGEDSMGFSWLERTNRENVRDVRFVRALEELIPRAGAGTKPVSIWTAQMGFVPYHLARRFYRHVRFFDLSGLTDRARTTCNVGQVDFAELEERAEACGIAPWDIVYGLEGPTSLRSGTVALRRIYETRPATSLFGVHVRVAEYGIIWVRDSSGVER